MLVIFISKLLKREFHKFCATYWSCRVLFSVIFIFKITQNTNIIGSVDSIEFNPEKLK